jgi:hypothetical protein
MSVLLSYIGEIGFTGWPGLLKNFQQMTGPNYFNANTFFLRQPQSILVIRQGQIREKGRVPPQ